MKITKATAAKRKAIALDVIKQIAAQKFVAKTGRNRDGAEIQTDAMRSNLEKFFNKAELGIIEASFERNSGFVRTLQGMWDERVATLLSLI